MEANYALELIQKGKRVDGRVFEEYRDIIIEGEVSTKAEGSARVKLGETEVVAGIKLNVGTPFADTPNQGNLIVNAEFSPIASPDFEAGPPSEDAIEVARVVDRGIRESKMIDLEKLVITAGEKVWNIIVDVYIINHQGNLLDAAALASVIALHNTKIPKYENEQITRGDYSGNLPTTCKPITVTVCKVGETMLIDPTFEEEEVVDSRLSIAINEENEICALQKQGKKEFELEDIKKMVEIAIKKSKELRKKVK